MFQKLWIFLTEEDTNAKSHNRAVMVLLALICLGLSVPLVWHRYIPIPDVLSDDLTVKKLENSYLQYLDSLDSLKELKRKEYYQKKYRKNSSKRNINKEPKVYRPYSDGSNRDYESPVIEAYQSKHSEKKEHSIKKFNLNHATKLDLIRVKGIGDYYATRIIKFRDKLGGYYSRNQLYEVYGLDSIVVEECFKHLDGSPLEITKEVIILI